MTLSRREIAKDLVQQTADATFATSGRVVAITIDAARNVTHELGSLGTELFEIGEAARRAGSDNR